MPLLKNIVNNKLISFNGKLVNANFKFVFDTFETETKNYFNRVYADGGIIDDIFLINRIYKYLKTKGISISQNAGVCVSPRFGNKYINGALSKAYCLFDNDLTDGGVISCRPQLVNGVWKYTLGVSQIWKTNFSVVSRATSIYFIGHVYNDTVSWNTSVMLTDGSYRMYISVPPAEYNPNKNIWLSTDLLGQLDSRKSFNYNQEAILSYSENYDTSTIVGYLNNNDSSVETYSRSYALLNVFDVYLVGQTDIRFFCSLFNRSHENDFVTFLNSHFNIY